jgi:hypothetical protein
VLASILSRDGYLPRQLHTRGDRLAFSNGIILLSGFAILLIVIFQASPTRLIQLYIIGVFVSFVCSQTGMIRHWNRHLRTETDSKARLHMIRSRTINTIGACFTAVVLVIVLVSKFASGAWIVVVAMPMIWLTMRGIHRHYASVAIELAPPEDLTMTLPASNRSIVLVSKLHLPTMRALAYARATRPSHLEAVTVDVDEAETRKLKEDWDRSNIPVPLIVVASPYREITRPIVGYVKRLRRESPRDIVTLYVPEYVLGHWWEQLLHNQSALRLKTRLLLQPGVVVASVPYQLKSALHVRGASAPAVKAADLAGPPAAGGLAPWRRLTAGRDVLHAEELQVDVAETSATPIGDCMDYEFADVSGTLRTVTLRPRGTSLTMEAELWDGTGNITLIWLGRRDIPGIRPGRRVTVHGRIARIKDERTIYNPSYQLRPGPE